MNLSKGMALVWRILKKKLREEFWWFFDSDMKL
jgi:hypothetical protein